MARSRLRTVAVLIGAVLVLASCVGAPTPRIVTVRVQLDGPLDTSEVRERVGAVLGRHNAHAFLREATVEGPLVSLVFEGDVPEDLQREVATAVGSSAAARAGPSPATVVPVDATAPTTSSPATAAPTTALPTSAPPVDDAISLAAARRVLPAVVHLRTGPMPNGTGFVVSADGLVLTNSHVAKGMGPDSVAYLYDGRRVAARVVGRVEGGAPDIAVVKIDASGLVPVEFADAAALRPEAPLLVIGHPQGYGSWLVTAGKLLKVEKATKAPAPDRTVEYQELLADVPGAPGSSGSPFVDMSGRVVGILFGGGPQPGEPGEPRPGPSARIIWDQDAFLARAPRHSSGVSSEDARRVMREIIEAKGNVP